MQIATYVVLFVLGLAILYAGAEALLKGAVSLARSFGISPFVIGLTLVAFGTSAPELSLDLTAAFRGSVELAFGDLVGSNIANIGLILGVAALIYPLRVEMQLLKNEIPIVIAVSLLLWVMAYDSEVGRIDATVLLFGFAAFLLYAYRSARGEVMKVKEPFREEARDAAQVVEQVEQLVPAAPKRFVNVMLVSGGLLGLVVGAQFMVFSAVAMARLLSVSELMIGLTVVAIGTSLPELATSIVAASKREGDIIVGNVLGSNLFNILGVMGSVALVHPIPVELQSWQFDVPVMIGFAVALVPIVLHGLRITRVEGGLLFAGYMAFLLRQIWLTM